MRKRISERDALQRCIRLARQALDSDSKDDRIVLYNIATVMDGSIEGGASWAGSATEQSGQSGLAVSAVDRVDAATPSDLDSQPLPPLTEDNLRDHVEALEDAIQYAPKSEWEALHLSLIALEKAAKRGLDPFTADASDVASDQDNAVGFDRRSAM